MNTVIVQSTYMCLLVIPQQSVIPTVTMTATARAVVIAVDTAIVTAWELPPSASDWHLVSAKEEREGEGKAEEEEEERDEV